MEVCGVNGVMLHPSLTSCAGMDNGREVLELELAVLRWISAMFS
jgi:hypothetical protein